VIDPDVVERRRTSLAALGRVEELTGARRRRPSRTPYLLGPNHAVRVGREEVLEALPTRLAGKATVEVVAACTADVIVFGKFDRPGTPRLRTFRMDDDGGGVAWKVQPYHGEDEHGIGREISARRTLGEIAPHVSPALFGHGVLETDDGQLGYLHEELVVGRHVRRWGLHEIVRPLVTLLADMYTAAGIRSAPWSEVGASRQRERWADFVDQHEEAEQLRERVDALLRADRDVEVSLVHGDPVASNVVVRPDGSVVLVDWEYAREHAVGLDLTKPVQQSVEQKEALAAVEEVVGGVVGVRRASYSLHEQLALPQVQTLCWSEQHRAKSKQSGRLRRFREVQAQRLELLELLLS
jgi:hypothetical protein